MICENICFKFSYLEIFFSKHSQSGGEIIKVSSRWNDDKKVVIWISCDEIISFLFSIEIWEGKQIAKLWRKFVLNWLASQITVTRRVLQANNVKSHGKLFNAILEETFDKKSRQKAFFDHK